MGVFYFDMDGVLANVPQLKANDWAKVNSVSWNMSLQPFAYNVAVVRWLIEQGHKVYILSRSSGKNQNVGKMEWIKRYLPTLPKENIILVNGTTRKTPYIREKGVLVDDTESQCRAWSKVGLPAYWLPTKGENIDVKKLLYLYSLIEKRQTSKKC